MQTKLYEIQMKYNGIFVPLSDAEYTLQEVRKELKELRGNHPEIKFRRHYLRTQEMDDADNKL